MTQADMVGTLIDSRFRVLAVLGAGTFGAVYKVEQPDLDRVVALKMLHGVSAFGENVRARFEREVQVLASLHQENIITVYGCGTDSNNCLYLSMEYLDGRTLGDVLASEKRLDWRRVCRIGIQACAALSAAHKVGVVHRDIAPKNIMLVGPADSERVKVLDFGLSSVLPQSDLAVQRLTQTGMVVGTLLYMSPEAIMGQKADELSDVYSLGCVLYECLLGRQAFDGDDASQFMHEKQEGLPERLLGQPGSPEMPKEIEAVIFKALQKKANRFQSAAEFGEALHLVLEGRAKELRLSGVKLGTAVSSANRPILASLLLPLCALLLVGLVGSAMIFKPWNEPAKTPVAPQLTLSPGMQDRLSDLRRAREYVAQARASKENGNYSEADSRARAALLLLAHDYKRDGGGRLMLPQDLDVLNQIADVYDRGAPNAKIKATHIAGISGLCWTICARAIDYGTPEQMSQFYGLLSILCEIFDDPAAGARFLYMSSEFQPLATLELVKQFRAIAETDMEHSATARYYISLAEARILMAENKPSEAKTRVDAAKQALAQIKTNVSREVFTQRADLYKAEVLLHDDAGAKQAYEAAEKAALAISDELEIGTNGFGNDNSLAAESFNDLVTASTDPQLKARAMAYWKRFSTRANARPEMESPLAH